MSAKAVTNYHLLVARIADGFTPGDLVRADDLPELTASDLDLIGNEEDSLAADAIADAAYYTGILNSGATEEAQLAAIGRNLRDRLINVCRVWLAGDVTTELYNRTEPGDWRAKAADEAGIALEGPL
jgi:hypothetical protein